MPQLAWAISPSVSMHWPCSVQTQRYRWPYRTLESAFQSSGKNPSALLLFIGITICFCTES
jgi:hypothetical protein